MADGPVFEAYAVRVLLEAALEYIRRGWPVFPVHTVRPDRDGELACSCGRVTCEQAGKHPRTARGFKDASMEELQIRAWWAKHPASNVGIVTGKVSQLVVLDVDPRHGGEDSLKAWIAENGPLPSTLEVRTGGGGRHLYFRYPAGAQLIPSHTRWQGLPGLDLKAEGGYVIGPGSLHRSGDRYEWKRAQDGAPTDLAPFPLHCLTSTPVHGAGSNRNGGAWGHSRVIPKGERNVRLTSLAGSLRRNGSDRDEIQTILDAMNEARCQPRLPRVEVSRIAASVANYPAALDTQGRPLTDLGNGERLADRYGQDLLYCPGRRQWFLWDGCRWKADHTAEVERLAMKAIRAIHEEAARLPDGDARRPPIIKHALHSEGRKHLEAMLAHAKALLAMDAESFDGDPWALNVQNGTLDLRTGALRDHSRADRITMLAPVDFEPYAEHPTWTRFLEKMIPDPEVRGFLKRACGYSLTGDTSEKRLLFLHGPADAGKTTFVESYRAMLGDYAATSDFEAFLKRKDVGIRNDLARLAGKRAVFSIEVDEGRQLAVAVLKNLTGGDTVAARFLYRESFEFRPTAKLWLVANEKPRANPSDLALWRRVLLAPFPISLSEEEQDPTIKQTLIEDPEARAGILSWAVQGLREWHEHGLQPPDAVRKATEAYRDECDDLRGFFEDCCVLQPDRHTTSSELTGSCEAWCRENGVPPPTAKALASALQRHGCVPVKISGQRGWTGIGLLTARTDRVDG